MQKYGITLMAGLAALAIASTASAQTNVIRITGSTAFRKGAIVAIGDILNAGYVFGFSGSAGSGSGAVIAGGASQAEFRGTTKVGSFPVDIKCSWAGSVGGVQTLVQNLTIGAATTWLNGTNLTAAGASGLTGPYDAPVTADITMSDSFQGSTLFTSPLLVDKVVGVVPFQWARNAGSPSSMSNMTALVAQALFSAGQIPLSQVTGLNADEGTIVTALGRDEDSGTRLDEFAECGFGVFTPPFQYQPVISGTPGPGGTVTGVNPWPTNTVNGIAYPVGHSGYSSGGSLSAAMNTPGSLAGAGGWFIAYLGINDAAAITLGAPMTYNGVAYSATAVEEGSYTAWSYEHLMYRNSLAGNALTIANQLATEIHDVDATVSGVLVTSMKVGRAVEGGVITFGNPY